eukprot:evm.model.NODE_10937_length_1480_cov_13.556757.1
MKLWRCLDSLRRNQAAATAAAATAATAASTSSSVVPYRESKLTHLFMNHLSGSK